MSGPACAHGCRDRLADLYWMDRSDHLTDFSADGGAQASHETIQDKLTKPESRFGLGAFAVNKR